MATRLAARSRIGSWFAFLLTALVASGAFAQALSRQVTFDVGAQPLATAVIEFSKQAQIQVLASGEKLNGVRSPGVKGRMSVEQGLQRLLEGTGFSYRIASEGTVSLVPAADSRTSGSGRDITRLESLMVTATKRLEALTDVPQSVAVLPADDLVRRGATQFRDYADLVPGLSLVTSGAGNTLITLRGVTVGLDINSTTAIYVDDVPYGSSTTFGGSSFTTLDASLFDLDRVEVLRGPQGTLYGASSMGGLIKYVTRLPNTERFSGEVQAGLSNTQDGGVGYTAGVAMNVPLSTGVAGMRGSVFSMRDGGYVDNVRLGDEDVNRTRIDGGRVDLLLTPTRDLSIRLGGFAQDIDRDGPGTVDYTLSGAPIVGDLQQDRFAHEPFTQRYRLLSATVDYDLGASKLTSVTGYQRIRNVQFTDSTRSLAPVLALCPPFCRDYGSVAAEAELAIDKFSQELRLASQQSRRLEWIVGGFYTRETTDLYAHYHVTSLQGAPMPNEVLEYRSPSTYKEFSGFGDLTWHFTDKLDATIGARFTKYEVVTSATGSGFLGAGSTTPERDSTDDVATYLANARYRLDDRTTAYARFATGYRPGGPNVIFTDPATGQTIGPPSFGSDSLRSYEAGFRKESADRALALDVAAYYIDWDNIQLQVISGPYAYRDNVAGGARISGLELGVTARPFRDLTVSLATAFIDAKLADAAPNLRGRDGERLPSVPRSTANLVADYSFSGWNRWKPTVGTTIRYVSERHASFDASTNPPQYILPDYTTIDFRAGLSAPNFDLQFYVRNATDERGQLSALFTATRNRVAISQPRTYGLIGTYRF